MSTPSSSPLEFVPTLATLLAGRDLTAEQTREMVRGLLGDEWGEAEIAALLVALASKGETAEELAAAAEVLRERMAPMPGGVSGLLDTCGTGGDGLGTFNISTATALVVAAAGVPVVKHGNRAMSSRSGSADVLAVLGVRVEADAATVRRCVETVGIGFCLAPLYHPAMKAVGPVRRRLGVRTLFNQVGPLCNPAGTRYQLIGVGNEAWLDPMAGALARLGTGRALLVRGSDGLDEVSLSGPTMVRSVRDGMVASLEWSPDDFGLAPCRPQELQADGPEASAAMIRDVLEGKDGPALRVVLANAAAALLVSERVADLREGVALAGQAVRSGRARQTLAELAACSSR